MQTFQDMNPFETIVFLLFIYSPYYLPIVAVGWLVFIGVLVIVNKRAAAKRGLIVFVVTIVAFLLLRFLMRTVI